jgi:NitT/TauT family transport system substrate-binding protein
MRKSEAGLFESFLFFDHLRLFRISDFEIRILLFSASSMFKPRRTLRKLASAIVMLILFCAPASAADKLRIGYGAPSVTMSILWITKEGKLFEKNGLDVEVLYLESALVQRALITGTIAFGEMTGSLMAAPKLQGADLVMVASFLNNLLYRLVARPEVRSVTDLKGKRVGVSRFGAGADRATRLLLTKLGLNPEKDVVLLQIGGSPIRNAALLAGSIDATIVDPPDHKRLQEAGMRILANMEEMKIPFQHTGLVTTRAQVSQSPDLARRVVKSFVEGIQLASANSEVSKRAFRKYLRLQQERELDDAYQLLRSFVTKKPYPTVEGFKAVLAELAEQIPAAKIADAREFFDTRFLEELDRSGYIDGLYR